MERKYLLQRPLLMHRYSADILSYSGPSGILGSHRKQNAVEAGASGRANCCTFH